jgi:cytochrome c biogenesis protein CcmG/thiol:disulfide interchange protein DsbE
VGVLTDDPEEPARQFVAEYHATWPTVVDPNAAIKRNYRVVARPHSWFIDRDGILRSQQIGELTDADFERQYARIAR